MPTTDKNQNNSLKLCVCLFCILGLLFSFPKCTTSYAATRNDLGFPFLDCQNWYVFQGYNSLHQGQFLYAFDLVKDNRWDALDTTGGASIVAAATGRVYGTPYQINGPNGINWGKGFKMILDDGMILEYDHLMNLPSYVTNNTVITKGTEVGKVFNGKPGGVNHLHFQTVPTEAFNFGLWHYPSSGPSDGNGTWSGTTISSTCDTTPPTGGYTEPANWAIIQNSVIMRGTASDNSSGVDHVNFTANYNGSWQIVYTDYTAPYEYTWDISAIPDQTIVLGYDVYDKAGNYALAPEGVRTIIKDATPPTGGYTEPANWAITQNSVIMRGTASDNSSGVDHVNFTANYNGSWQIVYTDYTAPYEYTWDISAIPDQTIVLGYDVYDKAGNYALAPEGVRTIQKLTSSPTGGYKVFLPIVRK